MLKKEGNKILGYTPGKLRWKKMFAILKQNFIEPLKLSERNKYYYENAYALKLFAKNGYQLPSKAGGKKWFIWDEHIFNIFKDWYNYEKFCSERILIGVENATSFNQCVYEGSTR